jgi:anti-sigma regulatory factor (Ser/Thr protein kinase)
MLLTTTPQEVAVARRFAVAAIKGLGGDEQAQDRVRTLVSELVTNVVLHARTPAVLTIQDDGDCVRVLVTDGSPAPARPRRPGADSTSGRGLWLLQTLSAGSGRRPSDRISLTGKTVWFTVHKHSRKAEQQATTASALALFDDDLEAAWQ